jgi:hypothetical protein
MRKLLLALLLALASAVPAASQPSPFGCNKTFQVSQAAVALTKVISGVVGQSIGICGYTFAAGAATGTASISYGTGTNCGTGTVTVVPIISLAINGNITDHTGVPHIPIPQVNASGVAIDVCLVTTGTGPTSVLIYYVQQ